MNVTTTPTKVPTNNFNTNNDTQGENTGCFKGLFNAYFSQKEQNDRKMELSSKPEDKHHWQDEIIKINMKETTPLNQETTNDEESPCKQKILPKLCLALSCIGAFSAGGVILGGISSSHAVVYTGIGCGIATGLISLIIPIDSFTNKLSSYCG